MHHPTDRITHTTAFVTPVVEHWLEREIAQWVHPMNDRSDDPSHHERTCSQMSLVFPCHTLMDARASFEVEGNVMLQTACSKSTSRVTAVSRSGRESIMVVEQLLCIICQVHRWTSGIETRFRSIMSFGGTFQHDDVRTQVPPVSQECLQRHNIQTLPWPARVRRI